MNNHPEPQNFEALARSAWPEKPPRIDRYTLQDWVERVRIPAAQVSVATARVLLGDGKASLEEIARASEKPGPSSAFHINGIVATLRTDVNHHVVPDRNVVAGVEGSDPQLKNEWVVISCHHDHNGADGDLIFNGADDNGSGTVGMLEIAEAYVLAGQEGHRPKRSILFASFNSEERGLLGSWAFVERPLVPLDRIVAVLNMDMVGRDEEVPEGGGSRFRGLPVQSAESNHNAVNLLGHSRKRLAHPDDRAGQRLLRLVPQEGPGQQFARTSCAGATSGRSSRRVCRRCFFTRACTLTTTPRKTGPRRSITRKWSGSCAWSTRQAGTSPSNQNARGWIPNPRAQPLVQSRFERARATRS